MSGPADVVAELLADPVCGRVAAVRQFARRQPPGQVLVRDLVGLVRDLCLDRDQLLNAAAAELGRRPFRVVPPPGGAR